MKRWRAILALVILAGVSILAYTLADEMRDRILSPLAYQFWFVGRLYRTIPQQFIWLVIILVLMYLTLSIFYGTSLRKPERPAAYSQRGAVEALSNAIVNRERGIYFKWRLANLLANVAIYI